MKFSSARFICGSRRSSQPTIRACRRSRIWAVLPVLGVQLFSFLADKDFLASVVVFHADKATVLEQIQRRVDYPGLGL